jgi:putative cell wall-binding protein
MMIRYAMAGALALVVAFGSVSPSASAADPNREDSVATSKMQSVAKPETVATLQDKPYYYQSSQHFSPNTFVQKITRNTTSLRIELGSNFLAADPQNIEWHLGVVSGGSTSVELSSGSVEIPIPPGFFDQALAIYGTQSTISVSLHANGLVPDAGRIPTDYAGMGIGQSYGASAGYTVRLSNSLDSPAVAELRLSDNIAGVASNDERYWASIPDEAVIQPDSLVRFQSSTAIWSRDTLTPAGVVTEPQGVIGYADYPVATNVVPVLSPDKTSLAVDFSQLPGLLNPRLTTNGLVSITMEMAPTFNQGVRAMTIAPVGSTTTLPATHTTRLAGLTRYQGAVIQAQAAFPNRTPTVYVASGEVFSDALSAGAAAATRGAPLVLTSPRVWTLGSYLRWLQPSEIVVVGGPNSVPDDHISSLLEQAGLDPSAVTVRRDSGSDRYEASRTISATEFPEGADTAFLATGASFADALSSIPAAAASSAPVILVRGDQSTLDAATSAELARLGVEHVVIAGGPASISTGIEQQLRQQFGDGVVRFGGATRFDVADSVNAAYFPDPSSAYLATGANFPDALTGGVLAGVEGVPLLLARAYCVPAASRNLLDSWKVEKVTLLGGINSLGTGVQSLNPC